MSTYKIERHLDPDATGSPLAKLPGLAAGRRDDGSGAHVAIVVAPSAADTARGQLLTWVTANLMLRCFGAIDTVTITCADHPLVLALPTVANAAKVDAPIAPTTLHPALVALRDGIAGRETEKPALNLKQEVQADQPVAATLYIGGEPADHTDHPAWILHASNWKATIVASDAIASIGHQEQPEVSEPGEVMVAAWFAAAIGVGEIFKVVGLMRADAGKRIDVLAADLWSGVIGIGPEALRGPDGPSDSNSLPSHWLVGAGAVGEVYLAVLSTSRVDCDIAVVDHDVLDDPNLNRHVVAGIADIDGPKAGLAVDRLGNRTTRLHPLEMKWNVVASTHPDDLPALPSELIDQARNGYRMVISAVDKNRARTDLAAAHPDLLFSASTYGLAVEVGRYSPTSPWQCLGCASPVHAESTVEEAAQILRGLTDAELEVEAARAGLDLAALRSYLAEPKCGTLGEREIAKFAAFTGPDWSVSFVSALAGALLAARVVRHLVETSGDEPDAREHHPDGDTVRFWLHNATWDRTHHRRRRDCPICGGNPSTGAAPTGLSPW